MSHSVAVFLVIFKVLSFFFDFLPLPEEALSMSLSSSISFLFSSLSSSFSEFSFSEFFSSSGFSSPTNQ